MSLLRQNHLGVVKYKTPRPLLAQCPFPNKPSTSPHLEDVSCKTSQTSPAPLPIWRLLSIKLPHPLSFSSSRCKVKKEAGATRKQEVCYAPQTHGRHVETSAFLFPATEGLASEQTCQGAARSMGKTEQGPQYFRRSPLASMSVWSRAGMEPHSCKIS